MQVDSYEVIQELINFREVVEHFKENENDFLLLSTGGWHGTNKTLEDCERIVKGKDDVWLPAGASITVLVLNTEKVYIRWGEIHVKNMNEINWLKQKVRESLDRMQVEQEGNT